MYTFKVQRNIFCSPKFLVETVIGTQEYKVNLYFDRYAFKGFHFERKYATKICVMYNRNVANVSITDLKFWQFFTFWPT